ncbi:MAG: hypothetical protein ABEI86_14485, partial [Halobacteriaceae archaeon]
MVTVTPDRTGFKKEKEVLIEAFSRIAENPDIATRRLSSKEFMGKVGAGEPWLSQEELADFNQYIQNYASEVIAAVKEAETREEIWNKLYDLESGTPLRVVGDFFNDMPSELLQDLDEVCGTQFYREIDNWILELENQKCLTTAVNGLYTYFLLDDEIAQNFSNRFVHEIESMAENLLQIQENPVDEILLAKQTAMKFGRLWEDTLPPIVYAIKTLSENNDPDVAKIKEMSLADLISDFQSVM